MLSSRSGSAGITPLAVGFMDRLGPDACGSKILFSQGLVRAGRNAVFEQAQTHAGAKGSRLGPNARRSEILFAQGQPPVRSILLLAWHHASATVAGRTLMTSICSITSTTRVDGMW